MLRLNELEHRDDHREGMRGEDEARAGGRDGVPMRRFARRAYGGEATLPLPRARTRARRREPEPDAPTKRARQDRVELRHSAPLPIADPQALRSELQRLLDDRLDDARDVEISIHGDCVVLHGIVSCPLARLLAEDLVYSMPEIWECHNELVVRSDDGDAVAA